LYFKIKVFVGSKIWYFDKSIYLYFPKTWVVTGCEGSRWSRLVVGEAGTVPGDGVLEGVLQALRLGVAMATCSTGPSQNGEYG
jgi:hypothetical protein